MKQEIKNSGIVNIMGPVAPISIDRLNDNSQSICELTSKLGSSHSNLGQLPNDIVRNFENTPKIIFTIDAEGADLEIGKRYSLIKNGTEVDLSDMIDNTIAIDQSSKNFKLVYDANEGIVYAECVQTNTLKDSMPTLIGGTSEDAE